MTDHIYHIISRTDWHKARKLGIYQPESIQKEGFIHCSYAAQVAGTAGRYYSRVKDLIVLKIQVSKLQTEVRVEQGPNGDRFPHIYGNLNLDAVESEISLETNSNGIFQFSEQE